MLWLFTLFPQYCWHFLFITRILWEICEVRKCGVCLRRWRIEWGWIWLECWRGGWPCWSIAGLVGSLMASLFCSHTKIRKYNLSTDSCYIAGLISACANLFFLVCLIELFKSSELLRYIKRVPGYCHCCPEVSNTCIDPPILVTCSLVHLLSRFYCARVHQVNHLIPYPLLNERVKF